jgi:hypothetical protein
MRETISVFRLRARKDCVMLGHMKLPRSTGRLHLPVLGILLGSTLLISASATSQTPSTAKPTVTVYKSATCGCCSKWIAHMKANGFNVTAMDVSDIDLPKRTYGVPASAASCHTALVGGYVVEGHVPADAVSRMLREKPAIAGIAVPGMPAGSPGMEVPGRSTPYDVVSFDKLGKTTIYERR